MIGCGAADFLITKEAISAIADAKIFFGSERLILEYAKEKISYAIYKPCEIIKKIIDSKEEKFAILVSGDTGFYSAANNIAKDSAQIEDCNLTFIPGISSVQIFFARLKLAWQDAAFFSAHGRPACGIVSMVRRKRFVFCLTGNNTKLIAQALCNAGFHNIEVCVGENLSLANENIFWTNVQNLLTCELSSLCVLLFKNDAPSSSVRFGIPDTEFVRGENIPMTKSEVRAVVMSKLSVAPDDVCWDIGAGTGSITVEMALAAWQGTVYALEKEQSAIPLIKENCRKFHLGNVNIICGKAPQDLTDLPPPNLVFIGGSSGTTKEIINAARTKNINVRIVITSISIETTSAVIASFPDSNIVQIAASHYKKIGGSTMLIANNPITIITLGNTCE
ncbi:MAG: bifunctional cobalt-precorrin-7 (C(5))-methyltransferase/cobalt-precorrin-6B (C(15))-methyltransferase [Termitinemataceae bacterium]|nr:MAG: bifunctional cobalt-precorrin-7 (C(5))-methyltransferase/cobalt-precorrin-6B (C(15))-methyltransferase [Termitinemataceae bacterium]